MKFVVFSGIDGSGKSSVINGVRQALLAEDVQSSEQWLRFNHLLCKPLHAIARLLGLSRKKVMTEGGSWRHEFYRSRCFSNLYIVCTYIDTILGRYKALRKAKKDGMAVVIVDRWIPDILIDLVVKTRREELLTGKWAQRFTALLPDATLLLCIVRPQQALLSCRTENREDPDFLFREKMYQKLLEQNGIVTIKNDGTLEATVTAAVHKVRGFIK